MLLQYVHFSGIWLNKILAGIFNWITINQAHAIVWFDSRHHLALAWLILFGRWNVYLGRDNFSNSWQTGEKNLASRDQILASPASREAVKSRVPSSYLTFPRLPHHILAKSRIPRIPFQTLFTILCRVFQKFVDILKVYTSSRFFIVLSIFLQTLRNLIVYWLSELL